MKVLILSLEVGLGHKKVAIAIKEALEEVKAENNNLEVKIDNIKSPLLFNFFYNFSLKLGIWDILYRITSYLLINKTAFVRGFLQKIWFFLTYLNLYKELTPNKLVQFEIIVSLHPIFNPTLANYKTRGKIKSYIISIATDFHFHPLGVVNAGIDLYTVASKGSEIEINNLVSGRSQVRLTGIPIKFKTNKIINKPAEKTILVFAGKDKIELLRKVIYNLAKNIEKNKDYKLEVVTGTQQRWYKLWLAKFKNIDRIKIFPYQENMQPFIERASVIISKAGGISISEIITINRPLLIYPVIGGHEYYNALFLAKNNAAIIINKRKILSLFKFIEGINTNSDILENQRRLSHPDAASSVAKLILLHKCDHKI
jgi:processive 1,2-diacylglycerol beta-glucosyltransferase